MKYDKDYSWFAAMVTGIGLGLLVVSLIMLLAGCSFTYTYSKDCYSGKKLNKTRVDHPKAEYRLGY